MTNFSREVSLGAAQDGTGASEVASTSVSFGAGTHTQPLSDCLISYSNIVKKRNSVRNFVLSSMHLYSTSHETPPSQLALHMRAPTLSTLGCG